MTERVRVTGFELKVGDLIESCEYDFDSGGVVNNSWGTRVVENGKQPINRSEIEIGAMHSLYKDKVHMFWVLREVENNEFGIVSP